MLISEATTGETSTFTGLAINALCELIFSQAAQPCYEEIKGTYYQYKYVAVYYGNFLIKLCLI